MALTELPSTAPESLGPDKIDQRVYAGEPYRIQAFLVNKIRQYLIDIGSEVGLHDGSTVGSLVARVTALEAGGGGGGTNAQSIWTRPIYNGVAPTNGQVIAYDGTNTRWSYQTVATLTGQLGQTSSLPDVRGIRETSGPSLLTFGAIADGQTLVRSGSTVVGVPSAVPTSFYFLPGAVSPPTGAYTSWSALMAAIGTLRLVLPTAKVTVTVDGSAVGGVVDVPSGTYDWTNIEFVGAAFETLNFKAGASVTQFNQVTFRYLQLQTDATAGSPAFVTSAVYTWSIYFYAAAAFDLGAGYIPLFRSASGTGGLFLHFYDGGCLYQSGGTASAVADATGGTLYVNIYDSGYVESRTIASTNPASAAWFSLPSPAAMDAGASNWLDSHPLWTSGTITTTISSAAKYVRFTPTGTVAATTVQAAIAEVDSEKAAVSGGQIGGTGAAPDVRGIRETAGPTLLTLGAIADGQSLRRVGTSLLGEFSRMDALPSCQGLWLFQGNYNDSSGNSRALTRIAGTDLQYPTKPGVGQYGQYVNTCMLGNTGTDWSTVVNQSITVEFVLRTLPGSGATRMLMSCSKNTGAAADTAWAVQLDAAGTITAYMYSTGAAAKILASTVKLPYLEVCHLAVTFDTAGGQFVITIYLNGTSIATQTFASSSVQSLTGLGLYVGGYPATQFQLGDANGTTTIYGAQVAQGVASAGTLATRAATFTPLAG